MQPSAALQLQQVVEHDACSFVLLSPALNILIGPTETCLLTGRKFPLSELGA